MINHINLIIQTNYICTDNNITQEQAQKLNNQININWNKYKLELLLLLGKISKTCSMDFKIEAKLDTIQKREFSERKF